MTRPVFKLQALNHCFPQHCYQGFVVYRSFFRSECVLVLASRRCPLQRPLASRAASADYRSEKLLIIECAESTSLCEKDCGKISCWLRSKDSLALAIIHAALICSTDVVPYGWSAVGYRLPNNLKFSVVTEHFQ